MASIDIREEQQEITRVYFANPSEEGAYYLGQCGSLGCIESDETCLDITSKEDAQNLIKALEKAIELGWWKE